MTGPILFGEDPEICEARGYLPEPTRHDGPPIIDVLLPMTIERLADSMTNMPPDGFPVTMDETLPRFTFRKLLARTGLGSQFYAWVCLKDGKIYV